MKKRVRPQSIIYTLLALILTVGAIRELLKPDPPAEAPAPAPETSKPPPPAPKVAIVSVKSDPARASTVQEVVAQATPGVQCGIEHMGPGDTFDSDEALVPKTTDFQGHVSWRWTLEYPPFLTEEKATMKVTVICDGVKATRTYELTR